MPDGEISPGQAIRNVLTKQDSRTYLFILFMVALLARFAYDAIVAGAWLWGVVSAMFGFLALASFLVDTAQLRAVQRNPRWRWAARAWWLLVPLVVVITLITWENRPSG